MFGIDWFSVGVAAGCGAVAAGVASWVAGKVAGDKAKPAVTAVGTAILFGALYAWANLTIIAQHERQKALGEFDALVAAHPAYQALAEYAPETLDDIRLYVQVAVAEDHDPVRVENSIRQMLGNVVASRLPQASDAAVLDAIELAVDQMSLLHAAGDDSCFRYLFPSVDGGIRVLDYFSEDMMQRDAESTRRVLATYDPGRKLPSQDQAMAVLEPVYADLFATYGAETVAQFDNVDAPGTDRTQLCAMSIDLYRGILANTEEDAARALRWLLGQGG
ncbi:MAG: hypothetical protein R3176_05515 [Woeseiaceae bacterium]|nr:hypothetical protein [Woeseiaceae bacterium]